MEPICANWTRWEGLASTFAPQSTRRTGPFEEGITGASGGLLSVYYSTASDPVFVDYVQVDDTTFTFVMPDRDVNVYAIFDLIGYGVTPAPLPDGSYVHYAFFRNGTDLDHQLGAGYYDANSTGVRRFSADQNWIDQMMAMIK